MRARPVVLHTDADGPDQREPVAGHCARALPRSIAGALAVSGSMYLSYQILGVLLPYYISRTGAGSLSSGTVTAAFMAAATVSPLLVAPSLSRHDPRRLLILGVVLLALPTFGYPYTTDPWLINLLTLVRGVGFGVGTPAIATLVAATVSSDQRGPAMGWFGMVTSGSGVIGQGGGLYLAHVVGFRPVFVLAGVLALVGLPVVLALAPPRLVAADDVSRLTWAIREPRLTLPAVMLFFPAMAFGAVVTFAAIHLHRVEPVAAVPFFLLLGTTIPISRLLAGRTHGRVGWLLLLFCGVGAVGLLLLGTDSIAAAPFLAALLFGVGFGVPATVTQIAMLSRAGRSGYGSMSVLFTAAWNFGMGVGALLCGLLAAAVGIAAMFRISSSVFAIAAVCVVIDRRLSKSAGTLAVVSPAGNPA